VEQQPVPAAIPTTTQAGFINSFNQHEGDYMPACRIVVIF